MRGEHLGELEELLLLCLRMIDRDASSLGIQQVLENEAGRTLSLGAIYAALDRLAGKGLVDSDLGDPVPVRGGRAKRYYRLTHAGRTALEEKRRLRQVMWEKVGRFSFQPPETR